MQAGRRIRIRGTVQGVGFRPWVHRLAYSRGVTGRVRNDSRGVVIEAFGTPAALDEFVTQLRLSPPPAAQIVQLDCVPIPAEALDEFTIATSRSEAEREVSIPADLATCSECAAEIFDPSNRRYRYAFTNCTNCGPRFTITCDVPYDRAATTMAAFRMCPSCQHEYESISDRRYHAEPNACPACGPALYVLAADGASLDVDDAIEHAGAALAQGLIVAVKGLGGFHLACDATSPAAVRRLRQRKHRDEKPFAVMVRDLPDAARLAELSADDARLLTAVERPIVLVLRRERADVCDEVAPRNPLVGLLLPYAPLHHLLLAACGHPLVMTSGNLSEEPIAYRNDEAIERLRGIADLFLVHDRDIVTRCDDSVARVIAGAPVVFRRARGYVPRPVRVAARFPSPVLGCGAHLKNTFCIGIDDRAYLGPHIGDLENLETLQSFEEAIARLERFLQVRPDVVAHDLHPGYLSTAYALQRPDVQAVGVQHHHAHIASLMAERGLAGPVLGVAYDGTGYGTDGTAWGGEVLLADYGWFERLATFRPLRLAGGDRAIRSVWRIALAALLDAFDGAPPLERLFLFQSIPERDMRVVRQMIEQAINAPLARGVGRYFDAVAAIALGHTTVQYEGQLALEWNHVADAAERGAYPYDVGWDRTPWEIDLRPLVRVLSADVARGVAPATMSARFHNTLVAATTAVLHAALDRVGPLPVLLTGGCFQNARLNEGLLETLAARCKVYRHHTVPPGDGGLALGQAMVAAAVVAGRTARRPAAAAPQGGQQCASVSPVR
jgi:hydrogenase maturation protein HypF